MVPSGNLIWHELVNWVGAFVPASPKDLPKLKKRLIRAGFRSPTAAVIFNGLRGLSTLVFTLAAFGWGLKNHTPGDNLLLTIGGAAITGYIAPMRYLLLRIGRPATALTLPLAPFLSGGAALAVLL